MATRPIESALKRWTEAGLIDRALAARLRTHEESVQRSLNWPVLIATVFGAVTVGAGVLLFVAAHWDDLSPAGRFLLVLFMVLAFHLSAGFFASRSRRLDMALHTVGTAALGGGIFLTGQIFNLQEHWPGGILLWAIGAWVGWLVLRQWPQALLGALLTPAWLLGEWEVATEHHHNPYWIVSVGVASLSITYLTIANVNDESLLKRSLKTVGALASLPAVIFALDARESFNYNWPATQPLPTTLAAIGWFVAISAPLVLAFLFRRSAAWMNAVAALWIFVLSLLPAPWRHADAETALGFIVQTLGPLLWECLGAIGLIAWGLREGSPGRVNLGMAGFGLAILAFYFSELMDKMGRSVSLIGLGVLLLLGGWLLERTRRRLVQQVKGATA